MKITSSSMEDKAESVITDRLSDINSDGMRYFTNIIGANIVKKMNKSNLNTSELSIS